MSDNSHDQGPPGHEIDAMPAGRLINIMVFFTVLTVGACIGLIQVFNGQRDGIGMARAKEGSYIYKRYRAEMAEVAEGAGPTADGKFYVSHARAKELMLADPGKIKAAPAPEGWVHPDDVAAGGQGGAAAPPPPPPAEEPEPEPEPAEGQGEPEEPAKAPEPRQEKGPAKEELEKAPRPKKDEAKEEPKKAPKPKKDEAKEEPKKAPKKADKKADDAKGDGN